MAPADPNAPYYAARAREYDATSSYQRLSSAAAVAPIKARYQLALEGKNVLEVACGTGYWTRVVALTAGSILATDVNSEVIEVARERVASFQNVRFQKADAYSLDGVEGPFEGAYSQFWWSHVPRARLREFLTALHRKLLPGSPVLFMDTLLGRYPLGRRYDSDGDILEERTLRNGNRYEIIKNFPTDEEIHEALAGLAVDIEYKEYPANGYWTLRYRTAEAH